MFLASPTDRPDISQPAAEILRVALHDRRTPPGHHHRWGTVIGTKHGSVPGTTKIVDNGPDPFPCYTIGLMSEGYTAAEMPKWEADAQSFADYLFSQEPFLDVDLKCAINIYRIDVISRWVRSRRPQVWRRRRKARKSKPTSTRPSARRSKVRRILSFDTDTAAARAVGPRPLLANGAGHRQQFRGWRVRGDDTHHVDREVGLAISAPCTSWGTPPLGSPTNTLLRGLRIGREESRRPLGHRTRRTERHDVPWCCPDSQSSMAGAGHSPRDSDTDESQPDPTAPPLTRSTVRQTLGTVGAFEGAHYFHCRATARSSTAGCAPRQPRFCAVCPEVSATRWGLSRARCGPLVSHDRGLSRRRGRHDVTGAVEVRSDSCLDVCSS